MLQMFSQEAGGLFGPSFSFGILLALLIVSALILWRRYRSRRQLVRRVAELEALSRAGRAIVAAQLDISALCELIAREASAIIDAQTLQIGLFEGHLYHIQFWTIDGESQPTPQTFDLSKSKGLVGWVRDNKRSLLVRDFLKEMDSLPARPRYISQNPPRSAIFIPLVSGSQAIGLLAAQSLVPDSYSDQDVSGLTIVANQAAAAIANATIYEQERTRAAHLELVGQIARQVNAINDLDELLRQVVLLTQETFGFDSVNIFGVEEDSGKVVIQASSIPDLQPGSLRLSPGEGLIGTAAASRRAALSNNTVEDDRFLFGSTSQNTRSEIAIPMIVDQELLGVLDVQSHEIGAFDSPEETVLEALAAQVAIAAHKARQFAVQRQQAWVTTAQLQVAEAVGQSPDLETLTQKLVRLTPLLTGVDQCAILLWDEDMAAYRGVAAFGISAEEIDRLKKSPLAVGDWRALDAVHVGLEPMTTRHRPPWLGENKSETENQNRGAESSLLPLVAKGQVLGVMVTRAEQETASDLSNGRTELLRNIAHQAAQGIESIHLQTAQQEEAWVNTALLQVAEAVNKLTDLNEILYTIVRMVPMLVGVNSCLILIWDDESNAYRAGPSHGISEMGQGLLESFEVDLSEFPLLETQDVERVGPDAAYYTFKLPQWMVTILGSQTANIFPLHARAQLVGALVVDPASDGRPISGRRLNIVTGIAQQAAIAVVNDQLYRESAERSRMEQELNVARTIQASLIPAGDPDIAGCTVSSFWQAAREVSGDFYDFMAFPGGRWGIAIADVADKGVPAALFMALSRTILRTIAFNRKEPAEVLTRSNELIYADTSSDLFVTIFYALWESATKTLHYASAGHNPPILVRKNGNIVFLRSEGIALGVLEHVKIIQNSVRLKAGDVIIFYTDGVTEAMNEDYDEFGLERLCMVASDARQGDAAAIVSAVTNAIEDHAGVTPQFDDITMVVMKL